MEWLDKISFNAVMKLARNSQTITMEIFTYVAT